MLLQDIIYENYIEIDNVYKKIVNTYEFQRLKEIKQLGTSYWIFPSANHTRFEHSLGTYHLTDKFLNQLNNNQPELHIEPNDFQNVKIAALCHDIGHGPYSHVFEDCS